MKRLLIISTLFFIGCANQYEDAEVTHEYDHILELFNSDLKELGLRQYDFSNTTMIKTKMLNGINGICDNRRKVDSLPIYIYINKNNLPYGEITTSLIYHELGHCLLGLKHSSYGFMTNPMTVYKITKDERLFYLKKMIVDSI